MYEEINDFVAERALHKIEAEIILYCGTYPEVLNKNIIDRIFLLTN